MAEQRLRLIAAMERLPLRSGVAFDMGREATSLQISLTLARVNDLPAGSDTTKKDGARRQLTQLADRIRQLHSEITSLSRDTRQALRDAAREHPESQWELPEIEALQIDLENTFNNTVRTLRLTPHQPAKGGRPKIIGASIVADMARAKFEHLTGRAPTITVDPVSSAAGGPFVTFLGDLFEIIGVNASAEAQARAANDRAAAGVEPGSQATMITIRRVPKEKTG